MNSGFTPIAPNAPGKLAVPASPLPAARPAPAPNLAPAPAAAAPASLPAFRPVCTPTAHAGQPVLGEPKITLERDGDRVTKIKVQCVCGHIVELSCLY